MCRNSDFIVTGALDLRAYNVQSDEEKWLIRADTPYALCVERVMASVLKWLEDSGRNEHVQYIADILPSGQGKTQIRAAFDYLTESQERIDAYRILGVGWSSSAQIVELQAADFLAYEGAREAMRELGYSHRGRRKSYAFFLNQQQPRREARLITSKTLQDLRITGATLSLERAARQPR